MLPKGTCFKHEKSCVTRVSHPLIYMLANKVLRSGMAIWWNDWSCFLGCWYPAARLQLHFHFRSQAGNVHPSGSRWWLKWLRCLHRVPMSWLQPWLLEGFGREQAVFWSASLLLWFCLYFDLSNKFEEIVQAHIICILSTWVKANPTAKVTPSLRTRLLPAHPQWDVLI